MTLHEGCGKLCIFYFLLIKPFSSPSLYFISLKPNMEFIFNHQPRPPESYKNHNFRSYNWHQSYGVTFDDFFCGSNHVWSCFLYRFLGSGIFFPYLYCKQFLYTCFLYLFGQKSCAFTVLLKQFITTVFVLINITFVPLPVTFVVKYYWFTWSETVVI